jgi:phage repressor protein C with HTH and peptisase S24 domain
MDRHRRARAALQPVAVRSRQARRARSDLLQQIEAHHRRAPPALADHREHRQGVAGDRRQLRGLHRAGPRTARGEPIPLIGLTQAGAGGFFDDGGFPVGQGWDQIRFPKVDDENAYALEVTGDSMEPLYRDGDVLIVSPNSAPRKGDRMVLRTTDGEVMAKILVQRTAKTVELASFNPAHPNLVFPIDRIDWMARIVWASQ